MDRRGRELVITALVVLCMAVLLVDGSLWFLRLDLTRSKAYSISPVSRQILRGIPDQVHITYFLSDTLRSLSPSPGRVIDLLREYEAESRGKVVVTVLDPDRTGRGEAARRFGILPQQIQVIQQNEERTVDVYSGIALDYLDRYTSLAAVFSPDGLEYQLSFAVRKLLAGRRLVVGIVIGKPGKTLERDFDALRTGLSRDYSLHEILPGDSIPPEVDTLLVVGGTQWGRQELQPIDNYIERGGKVLFAVKGIHVRTEHELGASVVPAPSALLDGLRSYGVEVGRNLIMDIAARDYRFPQPKPGGEVAWETIGHYPPWVSIQGPNASSSNPMTARFTGLDLLWPVALTAAAAPGITAEPLVQTTTSAWEQKPPFVIDPYKVDERGMEPHQYVLGLALTGRFPSWFAPEQASPPTRMVIVGDDDFLTDLMQFSDSLANVLFVENAVLWLSGNDDLLSIKTRVGAEGRLDRIQDPSTRSRLILAAETLNVVLIPAVVILAWLLIRARRRERKS